MYTQTKKKKLDCLSGSQTKDAFIMSESLLEAKFASVIDFNGRMVRKCLGELMFVSHASSFSRLLLAQSINLKNSHYATLKALSALAKIERGTS